MDIDFPLVLVVLTFVSGLIWLADILFFRKRRLAASPTNVANEEDEPKEPYLVDLSRSFFPVLAVVLVLRSFLVEPFQIPSGSMLPTLEVGDFILVNKYAYGLRLPVIGTKILDVGDPERGDVMVFRYPVDGETNYIKRVIGLPGDTVRYRDKKLFINDQIIESEFVVRLPPVEVRREDLGAIEHDIFHTMGRSGVAGEGEWQIPEGEYFMMGDNRDNSNDSRYWGTVPDELIVGKAFAIWMHWTSITSLPSFKRVGGIE
ncbi:signal peptidase I [Marinobacter sp. LV10R510-11A]|uniref:signal peptidase I n=1 Tax=Marinobacter sp. LV10R510-11A TaxID=1415568 RepID=UPI000BB76A6D|nr:signal peptidase I [Marinobacter sp. LV10R510-11A]SOB76397.1 signal peptidase I [Marinobacter sp. LV10R510-11A]